MNKKKVMLIDDSPMILFELNTILSGLDVNIVAEAEDGDKALDLFKKHLPDIVTLDIVMPGEKCGVTLLKQLLQIKPDAKVLMISALGNDITVLECLKNGAVGFVEKPFVREAVIDAVKKLL